MDKSKNLFHPIEKKRKNRRLTKAHKRLKAADVMIKNLEQPKVFLPWRLQKISFAPMSTDSQADLLLKKAERAREISAWAKKAEAEELRKIEREIFEVKRKNAELEQKITLRQSRFFKETAEENSEEIGQRLVEQQPQQIQLEDDDEGIVVDLEKYHAELMDDFEKTWLEELQK